jgi:tRNA dimethylallyltransferase
MLAAGLVAEVEALLAQGYGWDLPAMSALGYRQIGPYLRGECTLAEAAQRLKHDTRVFVRRQANWFKPGDPAIRWFEAGQVTPAAVLAALGA